MSHPALHELLGYLDDELSPHARTRVELHVENCVECRAQLDDLSVANAEIVVAHSEPREDGWDGIAQQQAALRARLAEMIASSTPQKQPSLRWTTSLAYAAALIVLTAIGGFFLQQRSKGPEQSLALPNPSFTPGATRQVSLGELCSVNDDEVVRSVPATVQQRVFLEYGLNRARPGDFEVDYLITPGLGGSDDVANLWPQPHTSQWNSYVKDQLEDHLHHMVCHGQISLTDAQKEIAANWIVAYKKYFHTDRPMLRPFSTASNEPRAQRFSLWRKQPGM